MASGERKGKTSKTQEPKSIWEETLEKKDTAKAKPYSIHDVFESDDVITHSHFGYGVVLNCFADSKIEVLFQEGVKLLIHDQPG